MGQAQKLVDQLWEHFESGAVDRLHEICEPDLLTTMPGSPPLHGPQATVDVLRMYIAAFSDMKHEVLETIESEDGIAVRLRVSGTQTGAMQMPQSTLPPTGRSVVWDSENFVKIRNGRIAEWRTYYDQLEALKQLGLMTETAPVG